MSKARRIKKEICSFYVDAETFEGTIDEIKNKLTDIQNEAVIKGFYRESVRIVTKYEFEHICFSVEAERDETLKEKQKRLEKAKKQRELKKEQKKADTEKELKKLESLAKKHGMKLI